MSNGTDDLLKMLEEHKELELENVKISEEKEELVKSAGAKLLLYQVRKDSEKHAEIYSRLIDIIKQGKPKELWDYRIDKFVGEVAAQDSMKKHIEIETEMIKKVENAIKTTDDEGIKMVLKQLLEDEKRHHKMLKGFVDRLNELGE